MRIKDLIELIQANISLLNATGLHIEKVVVNEESSRYRVEDFETLGYQLLMVISPEECAKQIPWPILKCDKKLNNEFQRKFCSFCWTLNIKHPQYCLPKIQMSTLREAKGESFMRFLYKLSTLAMETQIKKMMSPEEKNLMLHRPVPSKADKYNEVKIYMVKGALCKENTDLLKLQEYNESAQEVIEGLQSRSEKMEKEITAETEKLASVVEELEVSSEVKNSLRDLEDASAISVYNKETEDKEKELEKNSKGIVRVHNLALEISKLATREEFSMDGRDLTKISYEVNLSMEIAVPTRCENGDIRLHEVMKSFCGEVLEQVGHDLDEEDIPGEKPLYGRAQEIRTSATQTQKESYKILENLTGMMQDGKQSVGALGKNQHQRMKREKIPEIIKLLKTDDGRAFNLNLPTSNVSNSSVKAGNNRRSLKTIIHRTKLGTALVCSYKNKQGQRRNSPALDTSQQSFRSFNKRVSLARLEVPGFSPRNLPGFKLAQATSTPVVSRPGTSCGGLRATPSITSIPTIRKLKRPSVLAHQAGPSSAVLAASRMGVGHQTTCSATVAAASHNSSKTMRLPGRFQKPAVKKPVAESSSTATTGFTATTGSTATRGFTATRGSTATTGSTATRGFTATRGSTATTGSTATRGFTATRGSTATTGSTATRGFTATRGSTATTGSTATRGFTATRGSTATTGSTATRGFTATTGSTATTEATAVLPDNLPKHRKSLDDIIQRYARLKIQMNSRSDTDTK